jgi:hypothetical protein
VLLINSYLIDYQWDNLRKIDAPYIPQITDIKDTSNFDKYKKYEEGEKMDPFFGGTSPDTIQKVNIKFQRFIFNR